MNNIRPEARTDTIQLAHQALPHSTSRLQQSMQNVSTAAHNAFTELRQELHNQEAPRVITGALDGTLRGTEAVVRIHILSTAAVLSGAQLVTAPVVQGVRSLVNRVRQ